MFGQYSTAPTAGARYSVADLLEPVAALDSPVVSSKRVGHNRRGFILADGRTGMVYHQTVVVLFDPASREVTLNDGGWATMTTRDAMGDGLKFVGVTGAVWSAGRTRHAFRGVAFDRTATFNVDTGQRTDGARDLPMIRAVVDSSGESVEVTFDAEAKRLNSTAGASIPCDARRALLALYKLDALAREYHGRFCREDDYFHDSWVELFPDYTGHAGRGGRCGRVWIGCHRFNTADVRAAMRRIAGAHPEAAKSARREFLALRKAGTLFHS